MLCNSLFLKRINHRCYLRPISMFNTTFNKTTNSQELQNNPLKNFTPIYKFEFVRVFSVVNRLKLYNTILTGALVPSSLIFSELEMINPEVFLLTSIIGLTSCASLYLVGLLANRFIGFVYLNKEGTALRIAYLDFWGRRKDIEVPLNDVVPFSEVPVSLTDVLYLKFCRFSEKEFLKINFKYGTVLERNKFNKIFPLASNIK